MGWDAAVFGELKVAAVDAWREQLAASADVPDAAKHLSTNELAPTPVGELLDALIAWSEASDFAFADVAIAGDTITLRAYLPDDDYLDWVVPIAAIWAAGASVGAGAVYFTGFETAAFAFRLDVAAGKVTLTKIVEAEMFALDDRPEIAAIREKFEARLREQA